MTHEHCCLMKDAILERGEASLRPRPGLQARLAQKCRLSSCAEANASVCIVVGVVATRGIGRRGAINRIVAP